MAELIFWVLSLIGTNIALITLSNLYSAPGPNDLEDLDAWTRNYIKLQRRA